MTVVELVYHTLRVQAYSKLLLTALDEDEYDIYKKEFAASAVIIMNSEPVIDLLYTPKEDFKISTKKKEDKEDV